MMPSKLNHPGRGCRWGPQQRDVIFVQSEANALAGAPACSPAAGVFQHLVTVHDVGYFLEAFAAQCRGNQLKRGFALRWLQIAKPEAVALKNAGRQVGPAGPLAAV